MPLTAIHLTNPHSHPDFDGMCRAADDTEWASTSQDNLDNSWLHFENTVDQLMDKFIPKTKPLVNNGRPIYISKTALYKLDMKQKIFRIRRWFKNEQD